MPSPTQSTLKHLRKEGYYAEVVERWNQYARIRQDFAGICDIIAIGKGETICVQATSGSHVSDRMKKLQSHDNTPILKENGWRVLVIGWQKKPHKKGSKRLVWKERIVEL